MNSSSCKCKSSRAGKISSRSAKALPCGGDNRLMKPFLAQLGFKLTGAQTKVLREIRADMGGAHPMRRLLQGDVGSGKTAVAACTALMALESGFNVALMAPTEILAEQHFRNFTKWFEPLGVKVELQTGSRKTVESRQSKVESRTRPRPRHLDTSHPHTCSSAPTPCSRPASICRSSAWSSLTSSTSSAWRSARQLVRKGNYPHLLVMTATPIPRTLGLTLYGDLDVSVIDEMPGGRGRIKTFVRDGGQIAEGLGIHPRKNCRRPAGLHRLSARGGAGHGEGHQGGDEGI